MQTPWSSSRRPTAGAAIVLAATLAVTGCRSDAPPAAPRPAPSHGCLNAPLYGPMTLLLPRLSDSGGAARPCHRPPLGGACPKLAPQPHPHHLHVSVAAQRGHPGRGAVDCSAPPSFPLAAGLRRVTAVGRRVVLVRLAAPAIPAWPAYSADAGYLAGIRRRLQDRRPVSEDNRPGAKSRLRRASGRDPASALARLLGRRSRRRRLPTSARAGSTTPRSRRARSPWPSPIPSWHATWCHSRGWSW